MQKIIINYDALVAALDTRIAEQQEPTDYPVQRVCSWCSADMGPASYRDPQPGRISHGMCKTCAAELDYQESMLYGGDNSDTGGY